MFSFLSQGPLGELLAPVKSPQQQLHAAIEEHQNDKAMRLINEGVYFNSPDPARDEALPIHTACKAGNQAMVDTLMQMGADVNAKDRSGNLPLHAAAKAGKIELVKHLVGLGADVAHRNSYRQTAYDVATSHIVRQYLLPLQLRAEPAPAPGTLDAVHNPDKVFDYSNLAPPPTVPTFTPLPPMPMPMAPAAAPSGPGQQPPMQAGAPPPQVGGYAKPWSDPAVTRPIAADGFHCSVGNPELAAKYGHIKQDIQIAPPPTAGGDGATASGGPRVAPNPTQYSAFAAYGGRPPPRYVSYNVNSNTSAPFVPPGMHQMHPHPLSNPGSAAASPVPPYGAMPQQPPAQQQSGYAPSPPLAPQQPQQQQPFTPPPPPMPPASAVPPRVGSVSPPRASPMPPPPPLPSGMPQAPQRPSFSPPPPPPPLPGAATAAVPAAPKPAIPTLPAPNAVNIFQPDNGEDAIELDGR